MTDSKLETNIENYASFAMIRTRDNHLMLVNPNDQYISRNLMAYGEWEPHIRQVLQSLIKPGMIVMDIGANIGAHTLLMSNLAGDTGKVIAFEPCKLNHDILVHNCILNKCKNTLVYKYGCGDKNKSMYIDSKWSQSVKEDNYGCVMLNSDQHNKNDECIEIITVDTLNLPKLDVVKIDAEEMEDKVLRGMKQTLERCKPQMIVEIHEHDVKKVSEILNEYNYKLTFIGGIDFLAIPK